jgi:hypothetical protein
MGKPVNDEIVLTVFNRPIPVGVVMDYQGSQG